MIRTVFGSNKSETALYPLKNTSLARFYFSTRNGNSIIDFGDGSANLLHTNDKLIDYTLGLSGIVAKTYSPLFTGNAKIKFLQGLKDVYSWALNIDGADGNAINITDLENFLSQFPNLYSIFIETNLTSVGASYILKGDFAKIPNSVEKIQISKLQSVQNLSTDLFINLSNLSPSSKLKFFRVNQELKINGDLGKLPVQCYYFYIFSTFANSSITYTAGKVWASSFDTLNLPIPLVVEDNDNIFIDSNNSVTTAIGAKSWTLSLRSSNSDAAVAGLISKGFSVNCTRISDTMLTMPLVSNLLDSSTYANHATMVGTEIHSLGGLVTSAGNYAYIPNKTSLDFGTGSLRFGCIVKFNSITGIKGIIGKMIAGDAVGRYGIFIDSGLLYGFSQLTGVNIANTVSLTPYNDGEFHKIEVRCNRTKGQQYLFIDGNLINTQTFTPSSDNISRNARFWIGGLASPGGVTLSPSSEFLGIIKDVFVNKF